MLKLTYLENGFKLEHLNESLENWVNTRVLLALRSGTNIQIQHGTAAFLIDARACVTDLTRDAQENIVEICRCDASFIEITLKGIWLLSDVENHAGVFVTEITNSAESFFKQIIQNKQLCNV